MKQKKIGFIGWAMRYHNISTILVAVFIIAGVFSLINMPRNEFPQFTIRQGLVIGVYPGASSEEVEEQLTKQVENYLFGYKEVNKAKTYSQSKEGMMIVFVELNDDVKNADEFWSKLKHGLRDFKATLPPGVVALLANSDFGDTSAMLITLSSDSKSYKEMEQELKKLKSECRKIDAVSKIKDYGILKEEIQVNVQPEKLNEYNIKSLSLLSSYQGNGNIVPSATLKNGRSNLDVHFPKNFESEKDLANQIVYADPNGGVVRLKDIAKIERKYEEPDDFIRQNGKKTILLSLEMQPGNNIVQFGEEVNLVLDNFKKTCPNEIEINVISNMPKYVDDSVSHFMSEFLIAIIAVILVTMVLLPWKVASIAGFTVPIAVLISMGFLYLFGIELNTVSLAALVLVLGMIVDNAIVVIDNYIEKKDHGMSSWHAAIKSARELVTPIITATLAICAAYIPLMFMIPGTTGEFLHDLPITITIALIVSILVALFVVPFLNFFFIKKGLQKKQNNKSSFLDKLQAYFDKYLEKAFKHKKITLALGIGLIVLAIVLFKFTDQKLFPDMERNQFAVEVYLPTGTSLENTEQVMDSLEKILLKDKRIETVTSFIGSSSPRFHTVYAPNMPGSNYGQLLVNTVSNEATKEVCDEYDKKLAGTFSNAHVKWKILTMLPSKAPIEIRISGDSVKDIRQVETRIDSILKAQDDLAWVRTDWDEKKQNILVTMDNDKASRLGYSKGLVGTSLLVGINGMPLTTIWEGDYPVSVELRQDNGEKKDLEFLGNQTITSPMSFSAMPLRSFAEFTPQWTEGTIVHRNGTCTLTKQIDVNTKVQASTVFNRIKPIVDSLNLPEGISISYGGEFEQQKESFVPMTYALIVSIVIIFFILLFQFKKIKLAMLIMSTMLLALPGAAIGLFVTGYPFSVTAFIGITSLCGIVVRNGIILIDYLQELRTIHGMGVTEAALAAGKRRMRPIFLTSAAAAVGVIPMIISKSPLWGPLGTVICFGLLISMVLTLFLLPVLYTYIYKERTNRRKVKKHIPYTNISMIVGFAIIIATAIPNQSFAQTQAYSLETCKSLALENNKKLKEANLELLVSQQVKKEAFTKYFPKVSGMAVAMRAEDYLVKGTIPSMNLPVYDGNPASLAAPTQFTYVPEIPINMLDYINVASVSAVQPIFAGGRIYNGNKLAKLGIEVNKQKFAMSTSEVLIKTEELYWNILSLEEKLKTIKSYESMLEHLQKDVEVAVKAGLTQQSDLLKVQLKLNELQVNKMKLENGIILSYRALCQQIGINYSANFKIDDNKHLDELPESYVTDTKSACQIRDEYNLLSQALQAEILQKRMIVGENLPQIAVGAQVFALDMMEQTSTNGMVFATVSIPISDWWEGSHKIKEANFKIKQAQNKLLETEELLGLDIEKAKNEMFETHFQIKTASISIQQAKENLKILDDNYKAGVIGMSELLEGQALYQKAQDEYTDALCQYRIKVGNYIQKTGK